MNELLLSSNAEKLAENAESLDAFSGLKIQHVKKQITFILSQIGRNGIFDEYSKHDISHINSMLDSLDWIIPSKTQEQLTPADWLMITLSIYFHDLGMLVTKDEFNNRINSSFPLFKRNIINGNYGLDYKDKILNIQGEENQDRFIYQELVRKTHAERIKYWILDDRNPNFPKELNIAKEIKKLISPIDAMFKRDLAFICESHHLSDLEDFDKYKPNQQYGVTKHEKVNLHYCALILRIADLLHITSDRTPSIEYNLINPSDPISQEEWAKQRAVRIIRPQTKKSKDGTFDDSIPKDTLEVIAFFEDEKGFFGLISYIDYANKQLRENFRLNELACKQYGNNYEFPWKHIDDSNIETKDFERKQFEFILDQTRILDLLVGHTLYNDSSVVLRELTQNGIDAIKLKKYELEKEGNSNNYQPEIKVIWDDKTKELTFMDNGSGMTLEIIQNHLLKVGSSRYQDDNFKKKYPDFSPISRFGIGILTCFLIADNVDIITKSSDSEKAILLKIKNVHGKYLLKYLNIDMVPLEIQNHGTSIKLYARADVDLANIENDLKKWALIPNCSLTLFKNNVKINIGYNSPGEVLREYLKKIGYDNNSNIDIKEVQKEGITLAYAVKYINHLKEWDFLEYIETDKETIQPIGTCIEGIRVDFYTPGFKNLNIYALSNTTGKNAPKTNVARSHFELTPERENLLFTIYKLYLEHISEQLKNLQTNFSITWSADEANWLINSFSSGQRYTDKKPKIEDQKAFDRALSEVKCILIEINEKRELISINELKKIKHFWSIDCASYLSADSLIKEVKSSNTSALTLLKTIYGIEDSKINHIDILLCFQKQNNIIDKLVNDSFQVNSVKLIPEQRRLDLRWTLSLKKIWEEIELFDNDYYVGRTRKCFIQKEEIEINNNLKEIAFYYSDSLFILNNSDLSKYLLKLLEKLNQKSYENQIILSMLVNLVSRLFYYPEINVKNIEELINRELKETRYRNLDKIIWERIEKEELLLIFSKTNFICYDNRIWYNRGSFNYY